MIISFNSVLKLERLDTIEYVEIDYRYDELNDEEREKGLNKIRQCKNLSCLFVYIVKTIEQIPDNLNNLENLKIEECPKIKEIPKNLPKLRYLEIHFDLNKIRNGEENDFKEIPESLTNLKVLDLYNTLNKIEIPETVENLKLSNCPNVKIDNLLNLRCLYINNHDLKKIPDTLINLDYLYVDMCYNLKEIPDTLINLKELRLRGCNNIKEIPETLINLKELSIYDCGDVKIPENIKNIPNIKIKINLKKI